MDSIPKRKRGRPPKIRPVEEPPVIQAEEISVEAGVIEEIMTPTITTPDEPKDVLPAVESEDKVYKRILFNTLLNDVGLSASKANEMAEDYGRLSKLAEAVRNGTLPPCGDDFIMTRLKKVCLCR